MPSDATTITGDTVRRLSLRPAEAAEALGISTRKLWSMTAGGEIPHVRLGRVVTYPVDELRAWLSARTEGNGHK